LDSFDFLVIGGGPVGVSAAQTAAITGHSVALIERAPEIGGAGINTGTIPSKTLRETALALSGLRSRRLYGVDLSLRREATVTDFMRHSERVASGERQKLEGRLAESGVRRFTGAAAFIDPHTIALTPAPASNPAREGNPAPTPLRARFILIATGSSPFHPPEFDFTHPLIHDSNEVLDIEALPKKLAVIGAGVIGSEYASTFAALGAEVHLIDGRDILLPFLDREVSTALAAAMEASGIRFHWNQRVTRCDASAGSVRLTLSSGQALDCDGVLVCAGRTSNTADLNLKAAGLAPGERGLIAVDAHYRTPIPHIYAAGDVIGAPALAATGMEQARYAACHAFGIGLKSELAPLLPTGIYTIPEASMVGETEESLQKKGIAYYTGHARYRDLPRGRIIGDTSGFLKLLFRQGDGRILGIHIMGEHATDIVHIGLVAMLAEADIDLFNRACFNYPTLGDLYKYATYDAVLRKAKLRS
jgi:NAD(P) transhydrogenase